MNVFVKPLCADANVLSCRPDIAALRDTAYQLHSTISLIDTLKMVAQNNLTPTRSESVLESLPDELLAIAMRFACENVFDLITLSHVNREFRDAALGVTDMWSHLDMSMPKEIRRLCIERSKNAPLHLVLTGNEGENAYCNEDDPCASDPELQLTTCLVEFARHCSRWENIKFFMPVTSDRSMFSDASILYWALSQKFFHALQVPHLETLTLSHSIRFQDTPGLDKDARSEANKRIHFYHLWDAPHLRMLSFSGIVPVAIPGASIQELSLDLRGQLGYLDFAVALNDLHTFLRETPTLRKLTLWSFAVGIAMPGQTCNFLPITLGNLQELTFLVDHLPPFEHGIELSSFVHCLHLPTLSTLVIKLALRQPGEEIEIRPGRWFRNVRTLAESLIPRLGDLSSLTDLSLFVFDSNPTILAVAGLDLARFSSLRTLTLGVSGDLMVLPGWTLHPNVRKGGSLEQVNLLGCNSGAETFLEWITDQLRGGGEGENGLRKLKKVVVKKCASAMIERLVRLIPAHKLEFEGTPTPLKDFRHLVGYGYYYGHRNLVF